MKRLALLRHLDAHGCRFLREGGNHTVYFNPENRKVTAIPRHPEINDYLARKISRTWKCLLPDKQA